MKTTTAQTPARNETPAALAVAPWRPTDLEAASLRHAVNGDFRAWPSAYPVLAKFGLMERTTNGFRSIDPDHLLSRCRELLAR